MKRLCIFCGSSSGLGDEYLKLAKSLGAQMAERKIALVYGGGDVGLMGAVANGCLENGGEVFGVIPRSLLDLEVGHRGLTELIVVKTMHERKQKMYDYSDAFLAIPGGMGTLDEFCEILTWAQLNHHKKPCYMLNHEGFFNHLLNHFDYILEQKFLRKEHHEFINRVDTLDEFWKNI